MSIEALILGKLHQPAEQRTSRPGRHFVSATIRAAVGETPMFVRVTAFSGAARAALLDRQAGDAVALVGTLTPDGWIDREGRARASLDMVAGQVMTPDALRETCAAGEPPGIDGFTPAAPPATDDAEDVDDAEDFADYIAWREGGAA